MPFIYTYLLIFIYLTNVQFLARSVSRNEISLGYNDFDVDRDMYEDNEEFATSECACLDSYSTCIGEEQLCDGYADCEGGEDELNCGTHNIPSSIS